MKRIIIVFILTALMIPAGPVFAEEASPQLVDYINKNIIGMGRDPIIVSAVIAQNSKNTPLSEIQAHDETWKKTPGVADFMLGLIDSECGRRLQEIQSSEAFFSEIFVMDNQGANVAMTEKTSDYWQGDEAKFTESYSNGSGNVFIDDVEFDDSTQTYLVQVSFPVYNATSVVGAMTVGIDVDIFETKF